MAQGAWPSEKAAVFKAMIREWVQGAWRLLRAMPGRGTNSVFSIPARYAKFSRDWKLFISMGGTARFHQIAPKLFDQEAETQSGGGHYFYQDVWALRHLASYRPASHHDIGSRLDGFVAQATALCPVVYWDIRPPNFRLPNFSFRQGNILRLPVEDETIPSLSCLHVAEHIGLGRYGDDIDPDGTDKALLELERILQPGGQFLFAIPVGEERVEFNAHRIWSPTRPMEKLRKLKLCEFSVVTDEDVFLERVNPQDFTRQKFACGLYVFTK